MTQAELDAKMRILLAAKKLFAVNGFDGTSVRQICDEAGTNVALVSYYFGGKENVFAALFDSFFPGERISDFFGQQLPPVEGVKLVVSEVVRFRKLDPEMASITDQEVVTKSPRTHYLKRHVLPLWTKLRGMLETGREQGDFRFGSLDHALLFVMGSILFPKNAHMVASLLVEEPLTVDQLVRETQIFVLRGLGAAVSED
ncbi:TetR family transcriptional regulator [Paenibacillus sp. MBLB4367]|uniref:TetR/AcrR family transcriptional regulator n=1 Tax=Paenibacillus sp. MBLB4367 TaxID=3384767 RepID=UPI00390826D7